MPDPLEITPARLLEVADLVMDVIDKAHGVAGLHVLAARSTARATDYEIHEAVQFLVRCGYVERRDR